MSTNSIFMKGRLFGDSYRAVDLWEFRRELTLTKRLIKIAEKYVAEKETHSADSFEGVCFYIARSIITYSKSAFDNLVLGHFDRSCGSEVDSATGRGVRQSARCGSLRRT